MKKTIFWNVQLWKWYFTYDKNILNENEKNKLFAILVSASGEDIKLFMRFFLYIANTRNNINEINYKIICHFVSLMYPDMLMLNIEHIIRLGKKDDILYLMPNMAEKILKWVKVKVKEDSSFNSLLIDGKIIGQPIKRIIRYKPKITKNYKWSFFFEKLASDPTLNGINTGIDFDILNEYLVENSMVDVDTKI